MSLPVLSLRKRGETPYKARHKQEFAGHIIPFGALVDYLPNNPDIIADQHSMGPKTKEGIFMGYGEDNTIKTPGYRVWDEHARKIRHPAAIKLVKEPLIHVDEARKIDSGSSVHPSKA